MSARRAVSARAGAAIVVVLSLLLSTFAAASATAATVQEEIFAEVNAERTAVGLPPLARDSTIDAAAQEWANHLSSTGMFAHSTSQWRTDRIPFGWDTHGENIAKGYRTSAAVMDGWMNSPGHRDNLLRSSFTRIGVGYVASGNYWVQIFAGYASDRRPPLGPTPAPVITGSSGEGELLTASPGTWGPGSVTLAYQWRSNGLVIPGETSPRYRSTTADVGSRITVTITGHRSGHASVSLTSVATAPIRTRLNVERISGPDRYAVANAIAARAFPVGADVVYLVTGTKYPDALSAAPAATWQDAPLLLTPPTELLGSVADEIERLSPATVVIVGGPASVAPAVVDALDRLGPGEGPTVVRIEGSDRYAASRAVADYAFGDAGATLAYVSTGENFPDALSAGSPAGSSGAPVILVDGGAPSIDAPTRATINALGVDSIKIAGGPASVSTGIADSLGRPGVSVQRFSGADRFAASIAVNVDAFPGGARTVDTVYLATGSNFPDALAGSALAGSQGSPLFVIPATCVPRAVLSHIERLGATRVVLLGGPVSLHESVMSMIPCTS